MRDETPSEEPAPELNDRHVERLEALEVLLGLQSPLRPSQAAPGARFGPSTCGGCGGRIVWVGEVPHPHWRHRDLADLDHLHAAYRDELYEGLADSERPGVPDAPESGL